MVKKEETPLLNEGCVTTSPGEAMSVDVKAEPDSKSERAASPAQQSMVLDDANEPQRNLRKKSTSSSPPLDEGSSSKKPSPSPVTTPATTPAPTTNSRKAAAAQVQLIADLPVAREDALKTFSEIPSNNYQNKSIGKSKEMFESMTCDCVYEHGVSDPEDACGPYSDCINRLTQVECLADDCRCRQHCQNQRFQKRQYANIEIVLTELKGYGLRAEDDIPRDSFIYEYVGDVVSPPAFKKRMRDYALEGIQHFYFMMLQKDEFIDATKSGGIGRFANHSCNPNCYVAKWTVGSHVRMGIFAKRDVLRNEELTFNYNVDRYGHQAQTCYCGEPNCVGFIGGKTQSDIVTMDDLYLDALGITDEDEVAELKGSKKKKGKRIDDLDFMPVAKPMVEKEVPKLIQAIRQTQSKKVLMNLLNRLKITEDQAALRQLMRLRGYSVMKNVLDDYAHDLVMSELVLQCLKTWPLLNRNKVYDSTINVSVEALIAKHEAEAFKTLAQELLDHWSSLPLYKRIAKVAYTKDPMVKPIIEVADSKRHTRDAEERKRKEAEHWELLRQAAKKGDEVKVMQRTRPREAAWNPEDERASKKARMEEDKQRAEQAERQRKKDQSLKEIIAKAEAEAKAEEERKAAEASEAAAKAQARQEKLERWEKKKVEKGKRKVHVVSAEDKEKMKEKRLLKLVGAVVVKCMSKYAKGLSKEMFKKYAKELTGIIAEKEKKSSGYKDDKLESLSDDKVAKIKKFSKDYISKVLRKLADKGLLNKGSGHSNGKHQPSSSSMTPMNATACSSTNTPNSVDGGGFGDVSMGVGEMTMSVEEAMDMDPDSDHDHGDDDVDAEGDFEEDHLDGELITLGAGDLAPDQHTGARPIERSLLGDVEDGIDSEGGGGMYMDISQTHWEETADPRRRPRS